MVDYAEREEVADESHDKWIIGSGSTLGNMQRCAEFQEVDDFYPFAGPLHQRSTLL